MKTAPTPVKKDHPNHMIGDKNRPYVLHWPVVQYKKEGAKLGFHFSYQELKKAKENGGIVGVRRYLPQRDAAIELGIPPGSFVKCCLL